MKKIVAIVLSTVFVAGLMSGCGNKNDRNVGEDAAQNIKQTGENLAQDIKKTGEDVTQNIQQTGEEIFQGKKDSMDSSKFIGEERAKEIALEKAGITSEGVKFEKVKLDNDDGVWQYEVEFRKDRTEFDVDIKADDGTILSWDIDKD
ncbi:MAG: PepSY domain-containing protein [Clostridia bacterium]|nr:PepSY domain-containing protein [Clostridia bacterium]